MITLSQIIKQQWENPWVDNLVHQFFIKNPSIGLFSSSLFSPYSQDCDTLVNLWETRLLTKNNSFHKDNTETICGNIYFFTSILNNLTIYLTTYQLQVNQLNTLLDYVVEIQKTEYEKIYSAKVQEYYNQKTKELKDIEELYLKGEKTKSLSTNDFKYIFTLTKNIEDKYSHLISQYTWSKLNQLLTTSVKTDPIILELRRKKAILESIISYFTYRQKNFTEEIMTWKKLLDSIWYLLKFWN